MGQSFEDRVVGKQAERITAQQQQLARLEADNDRLRAQVALDQTAAKYWHQLQKLLMEHAMLYDEWERFIMFVKLHCDAKEAPGFTCAD